MASLKIKKGDHVIVISGRDKGKHGDHLARAALILAGEHDDGVVLADLRSH